MFKMRVALLGVVALLTVSGLAASTASAAGPYWHVGGSRLGQGVVKQLKLQAKGATFLHSTVGGGATPVTIQCENSVSVGATIEGQGEHQGQGKGSVVYSQCKVVAPSGCVVASPITTSQTKSYLAYNNTVVNGQQKYVAVLEPTQGTSFATLKFGTEATCPITLRGLSLKVKGSVAAEVVPIEKEGQEGLLNFPEATITSVVHEQQTKTLGLLFAETETAKFSGAYGARLDEGGLWGVFGQ